MKKERRFKYFAAFLGIFIGLLLFEICSRVFKLDVFSAGLARRVVGFPNLPVDVHQESNKPRLLYELRPNTTVKTHGGLTSPYETKYKDYNISINSLGFRNSEFSPTKKQGVYRIFFVGSSNTFGNVDDADTYPMQLSKLLDKLYPGKFEIINAGISGNVYSQVATRAQEIVDKYSPDLIIFQCSNHGRRSFYLNDPDFSRHYEMDHELFIENLPLLFTSNALLNAFHFFLIDHISFYRTLTGLFNYSVLRYGCIGQPNLKRCLNESTLAPSYAPYGDFVNLRDLSKFLERNSHRVFFQLNVSSDNCNEIPDSNNKNLFFFGFCNRPPDPEYSEIHPPSYVYSWYAEQLVVLILQMKKHAEVGL